MNSKYIKRQLTLHSLGLPINEKIEKHYININKLIGNLNLYEKISTNQSIKWTKNDKVLFFEYEEQTNSLHIRYKELWDYLSTHNKDHLITIIILNNILKCDFNEAYTFIGNQYY